MVMSIIILVCIYIKTQYGRWHFLALQDRGFQVKRNSERNSIFKTTWISPLSTRKKLNTPRGVGQARTPWPKCFKGFFRSGQTQDSEDHTPAGTPSALFSSSLLLLLPSCPALRRLRCKVKFWQRQSETFEVLSSQISRKRGIRNTNTS